MTVKRTLSRRSLRQPAISSESHIVAMNRLDLILPGNRHFSVALFDDSLGDDVLSLIRQCQLTHYVICRRSTKFHPPYEVLYCEGGHPLLSPLVTLAEPFRTVLLLTLFVASRSIVTRYQRNALFVFASDDFAERLQRERVAAAIAFPRPQRPVRVRVRLPTGLAVDVTVGPATTVRAVSDKVYDVMSSLYADQRLKPVQYFRFGTVSGFWPPHSLAFADSPELLCAVRDQVLSPHRAVFCFCEAFTPSSFDRTVVDYVRDLDLCELSQTPELRALNTQMSKLRLKAEKERMAILEGDPLRARMRVSDVDPPLTTLPQKTTDLAIKVELKSEVGGASRLSVSVDYTAPANAAIAALLRRMKKLTSRRDSDGSQTLESGELEAVLQSRHRGSTIKCVSVDLTDYVDTAEANEWVLLVPGMDEVLAGMTPLFHFVAVRQCLLSSISSPILNLALERKETIVAQIRSREMNDNRLLPESGRSSNYTPIRLRGQAPVSPEMMPGLQHESAGEGVSVFIRCCYDVPARFKAKTLVLTAALVHGTSLLCDTVSTRKAPGSSTVLFNELLEFQFKICSLPRAARFSFTLYDADRADKKPNAVATLNFPVFSFHGWMNLGSFECRMWLDRGFDFFLTTCQSNQEATVRLLFEIPEFRFPIGHVSVDATAKQHRKSDFQIPGTEMERLRVLCQMDSLEPITPRDRELLWQYRHKLAGYPELLAQTLGVIDYRIPTMVAEIPLLLANWQPPSPTEALTLLDAKFADQRIRAYAVAQFERFREHEMMLYMLQLVQALKYELYDDSPLARFLLRHGLAEPKFFGHQLFWQLMSEAHLSHIRQRFSVLVVNFIYGIGHWRIELIKGYKFTQQLVELNQKLSKLDFAAATVPFRQELSQIEIPHEFHLPMDPRLVVDSFIIDKCKVMNSKKKPFWLTFHNSSPFVTEPVQTLFKVGDDLRQDQLTLQVLKVMEYLWRENGYEFHMSCYGVLPTGREQGFIEVVPNAVTESELQKQRGAISGVWATDLFVKYFAKFNPEKALTQARDIFRLSSAAYAVATSVLGIADRHPGNIMVQQDGHFFHIDFGHFLGHWKMKLGVKREGELFHFSPACAETISEKDGLRQFEIDTQTAMAVLRKNSRLLVTLFLLMLGTGIPELNKPQDVEYIRKKLYLGMTDVQANTAFAQLIKDSMVSTRTKLNNLVHNIKQ